METHKFSELNKAAMEVQSLSLEDLKDIPK